MQSRRAEICLLCGTSTPILGPIHPSSKQERQSTYNVTLWRCRKAISITYSECVSVVLVNQHASTCAVLYCRLWLVRLCRIFPHYPINGKIFGGGGELTEHETCVLIFSVTFSLTFPILRRIQRDTIINVQRCSCKVPVIIVRF